MRRSRGVGGASRSSGRDEGLGVGEVVRVEVEGGLIVDADVDASLGFDVRVGGTPAFSFFSLVSVGWGERTPTVDGGKFGRRGSSGTAGTTLNTTLFAPGNSSNSYRISIR